MSPHTTFLVQIIFSFTRSFEISEGILRNQKIIIGFDSFSNVTRFKRCASQVAKKIERFGRYNCLRVSIALV